jgi:hypothetical protein
MGDECCRPSEGEDVAALTADLIRERDRRVTAERLAAECLRVLTPDQYRQLRETVKGLDELGGSGRGDGG